MCHGFPESWYSWRHQFGVLAEAGFHVVAPDMRGYGQTDRPEEIEKYTILHLVGDMVGLLDALGVESAVIVGHDWGAPVAWHSALLRPDRFRGVIGLSVPFRPRGQARPTTMMPQNDEAVFYQLYFQDPGIAEAEFERDPRLTVRSLLHSGSGDAPRREGTGPAGSAVGMVSRQGGFLTRTARVEVHVGLGEPGRQGGRIERICGIGTATLIGTGKSWLRLPGLGSRPQRYIWPATATSW